MRIALFALLALALLVQPAGAASPGPCPECGDGCVPEVFVETTRPSAGPLRWTCPEGCVPLERVASLREKPGCAYVPKEVREEVPQELPSTSTIPADGTASRSVFMPTAASNPTGQWTMTGYAAGLWQIEYALNQHVSLGSMVILPIFVIGAIPNVKFQAQPAEHFQIGGGLFAGLGGPYAEDRGTVGAVFGGHLEMSIPAGNHSLTLGVIAAGGAGRSSGGKFDMASAAWLLPNLAWRWAFHPSWVAVAELTAPLGVESGGLTFDRPVFVLLYGVRGHGDVLFGDIGFVLPLVDQYIKEIWKYTPLGIPYFSIGLKF